ncbi:DoxX family protein [Aequorivita antarctica]|uniref:DoxX family protein n=1 Tax=Aequorivita antarctica TaxID=153266 RepID=A0A5C6YW98_9FLAO|nr:DoxX family protein [Aequorivita antarctica]TXD71357.1 DoxX family protein [Aequorivita antarctica]
MKTIEKTHGRDLGLLLLRISIGILILFHGMANLNSDYTFIKSLLSDIGIPEFVAYSVFLGQIIAPILILIGWRARLASLVLALNMLTAILMAHSADVFTLNEFGGWAIELQGLYLFGAIEIFFLGAGKYAISTKSKWN